MTTRNETHSPYSIVVGVDIRESNELVLTEALRLARARRDALLHVVYVGYPRTDGMSSAQRLNDANALLETLPGELHRYTLACAEKAGGLPVSTHLHVRLGSVAGTLLQCCIDYDADVLVIGTHDRKGLDRFVFGSVADKLVHSAYCPVIVARPKNYEGLARTQAPDPVCDDCARTRTETEGERLWCEFHARPHVKTHVYGYADAAGLFGSAHDPGLIPG